MTDQDYLIHYGVLGMKWGVRKERPRSGVKSGKIDRKTYKEMKKSEKAFEKRRKSEYEYKRLSGKDVSSDSSNPYEKSYDDMIKKYGKKKVREFKKKQSRRGNAWLFGSAAGMTALTLAVRAIL